MTLGACVHEFKVLLKETACMPSQPRPADMQGCAAQCSRRAPDRGCSPHATISCCGQVDCSDYPRATNTEQRSPHRPFVDNNHPSVPDALPCNTPRKPEGVQNMPAGGRCCATPGRLAAAEIGAAKHTSWKAPHAQVHPHGAWRQRLASRTECKPWQANPVKLYEGSESAA